MIYVFVGEYFWQFLFCLCLSMLNWVAANINLHLVQSMAPNRMRLLQTVDNRCLLPMVCLLPIAREWCLRSWFELLWPIEQSVWWETFLDSVPNKWCQSLQQAIVVRAMRQQHEHLERAIRTTFVRKKSKAQFVHRQRQSIHLQLKQKLFDFIFFWWKMGKNSHCFFFFEKKIQTICR